MKIVSAIFVGSVIAYLYAQQLATDPTATIAFTVVGVGILAGRFFYSQSL